MSDAKKLPPPPYVAYKTFKNGIRGLHDSETGNVVTHVDNSVLGEMSGSTASQFMSALRFFALIDSRGECSVALKRLAGADDAAWEKEVRPLIESKYAAHLDILAKSTVAQLKSSFEGTYDGGSSLIAQGMRFLLHAATDLGIPVSMHIKKVGISSGKTTRNTKSKPPADPVQALESNKENMIRDGGEFRDYEVKFGPHVVAIVKISNSLSQDEREWVWKKITIIRKQDSEPTNAAAKEDPDAP